MTGLILVIALISFIWLLILGIKDNFYEEGVTVPMVLIGIVLLGLIISIPISKLDNKANIVKAKQLQILLDNLRTNNDITQFEKLSIMEDVVKYNEKIATWHVKSEHWYQNKWYYVDDVKNVKFIK